MAFATTSLQGRSDEQPSWDLQLALAGVVVAALVVLVGFSTASPQRAAAVAADVPPPPPGGGTPAPSVKKAEACPDTPGREVQRIVDTTPHNSLCGSDFPDRIVSRGGYAYVSTWGGVDYIDARNGKPDDLWSGAGADNVLSDPCDNVDGKAPSIAGCKGVSSSTGLRSLAAINYPGFLPTLDCKLDGNGNPYIRFADEPAMRAVDSTPQVDWETVAYSPLLYKWDGEKWAFVSQNSWLWDRTYDQQVDAFPGNYWRSFETNKRLFNYFQPSGPGIYRVAIRYRWYAKNGVPNHDLLVWAGEHLGRFEDYPGQQWCTFTADNQPQPALALPGDYSGSTDQQQAVSFTVTPERNKVTSLDTSSLVTCTPPASQHDATWRLTFSSPIPIQSGFSFTYTYEGSLTSSTASNVTVAYVINGKLDTAGNATGTLELRQISFDAAGVHYDCTSIPYAWRARVGS